MDINIVLHEPEIPQNTGNIARTCAAVSASLHIIRPTGFLTDDKSLRRAGLDYWDKLDITYYDDSADFFSRNAGECIYYFTTKGHINYCDVSYPKRVFLMFGKESAGIPEELLSLHPDNSVRIPMREELRSLNLANSAAIAVYEVLRQRNFDGLCECGNLTKFNWRNG